LGLALTTDQEIILNSMRVTIAAALLIALLSGCTILRFTRDVPSGTVVFTFDDGPNAHENTTARLLDVLDRHNVKALFCLIGENVDSHPELVRRMYRSGHTLANHGYTDRMILFQSFRQIESGLLKCDSSLRRASGEESLHVKYFRPASGWYRPSTKRLWSGRGMKLVTFCCHGWDAVRGPLQSHSVVTDVVESVRRLQGGTIVLHDGRDCQARLDREVRKNPLGSYNRSWIPEAVDSIIIALKRDGFRFSSDLGP